MSCGLEPCGIAAGETRVASARASQFAPLVRTRQRQH
jgi:hypothetical protein